MGDGLQSAAGVAEIVRGVEEARRSSGATMTSKQNEWITADPNISAASETIGKLAAAVAEFNGKVAKITIQS